MRQVFNKANIFSCAFFVTCNSFCDRRSDIWYSREQYVGNGLSEWKKDETELGHMWWITIYNSYREINEVYLLAKNNSRLSVRMMSCSRKWMFPKNLMVNVTPIFHGSTRIVSTRSMVPYACRFNHFDKLSLSLPMIFNMYHLVVDITNKPGCNRASGSLVDESLNSLPLTNHFKCSLSSSNIFWYKYNFKRWSTLSKSVYENLNSSHGSMSFGADFALRDINKLVDWKSPAMKPFISYKSKKYLV